MLEYKNVSVIGCGQTIVDRVSLALPEKGAAVLLGPSGCGKTTLLRSTIREDEEDPDLEVRGEILLNGVNIRERRYPVTRLRQQVGLVTQRPLPFPGSAFDNATFALRCTTRLSKKAIQGRAEYALIEAGLEPEHWSTPAECLSGGQLKRLSIARAIALQPEALLMDEPSNGLDPLGVARLERLISRLANDRLVLVVTHDVELARRIADEVFFLWPFPEGCGVVEHGCGSVLDNPTAPETKLFVDAARHGAEALSLYERQLQDCDAEECQPRRIRLLPSTPPEQSAVDSADSALDSKADSNDATH